MELSAPICPQAWPQLPHHLPGQTCLSEHRAQQTLREGPSVTLKDTDWGGCE